MWLTRGTVAVSWALSKPCGQLFVCTAAEKTMKLLLPPVTLAHVSASDLPDREHGTRSLWTSRVRSP